MRRTVHRRGVVLAAITVALVAAAGSCSSSANPPAPQGPTTRPASGTAATARRAAPSKEFLSQRYDFTVTLTTEWSEADGQLDWDGKELQGVGSAAFANFSDPAEGRTLVAAAARVGKGTQLANWRSAMVRAAPPACSDSSSVEKTTLGGEPALAWTATCSDGYDVNKLAALHEGRGYVILLPSDATNDDVADRRTFDAIRRSFRFTR